MGISDRRTWDERLSITDEGNKIDSSLTGHKGREREAGKHPTKAHPQQTTQAEKLYLRVVTKTEKPVLSIFCFLVITVN